MTPQEHAKKLIIFWGDHPPLNLKDAKDCTLFSVDLMLKLITWTDSESSGKSPEYTKAYWQEVKNELPKYDLMKTQILIGYIPGKNGQKIIRAYTAENYEQAFKDLELVRSLDETREYMLYECVIFQSATTTNEIRGENLKRSGNERQIPKYYRSLEDVFDACTTIEDGHLYNNNPRLLTPGKTHQLMELAYEWKKAYLEHKKNQP